MDRQGRRLFSRNEYENKILAIVFIAASFPVILVIAFFYCIFNDLVYNHLQTSIASQFLHQLMVLTVILLFFYFLFVGMLAYYFAHKLVGAFPRVIKEMDERIQGKTKTHILVRRGDYIKDFVNRVNALIDKIP
ncbi:MAG: hypothetical protein ABIJ41_07155 [Candidatus Omnitrophota bacterium]